MPAALSSSSLEPELSAWQTVYSLNCGKHHILSLDADEYANYIALLSNGEVWTNGWQLALNQQFQFPIIREIDADQFLIVESRREQHDNGHIFDTAGRKLLTFNAGDAVEDVVVQAGQIVVSYFDEGIGSGKPSSDGLAVFDCAGQQLFGMNSSGQPVFILDCYALTRLGKDSVLAYTYTGFPLLELRLTDYHLQQQPTPADFRGSHALTTTRGNVIFYGSYEETCFFWWNRNDKVRRFGDLPATSLHGIGEGKFLTYDANSFTIIDALALMREASM
ncbi:hypothetical protein [Hymenobacter metallicola]|uniref:6-bladed beta-propeller n=1 Tax=Hymenobacter metallicola TaxID=2563114 RepID=A0A4Z0QB28_9BACT|nr:hypothetical protein [Hymenobacter metallicola]TGE26666.1 hypothetical protein E5K02_17970 [Hymenobacter metallicola]